LIHREALNVLLYLVRKQLIDLWVLRSETEEDGKLHKLHQVICLLDGLNDELQILLQEALELLVLLDEGLRMLQGEASLEEVVKTLLTEVLSVDVGLDH
jgi:hypothetical protein